MTKKLVTFILLAFVGVSVAVVAVRESQKDQKDQPETPGSTCMKSCDQDGDGACDKAEQCCKVTGKECTGTCSDKKEETDAVEKQCGQSCATSCKTVTTQADTAETDSKTVIYYLHGNKRCHTCHLLESYADEAIKANFADQINAGQVEWKAINYQTAGNEHFVNDYQLITKSIIISNIKDGKEDNWTNLDKIWNLVGDKDRYQAYIVSNIDKALESENK